MFSILIATYNHARYLGETLAAVEAQTCADYELVIVDDGSTDATAEVVAAWLTSFRQQRSNRVMFSRIANSGQSAALEHGYALCTGRYICLLDSDDRWLPHKLQEVERVVRKSPDAGIIAHPLHVIDPEGRRTGDVRPKHARLSDGDLRAQLRRTGRIAGSATSGIVIRTDIFGQLVPMPTKRYRAAADHYLTVGACLLAPVSALAEPLAEYRLHPTGHHIRSMLSPEGLRTWVDLQTTVARHFELENVLHHDAYFARHVFALSKLEAGSRHQLRAYGDLVNATVMDHAFHPAQRLLLIAYWTLCMLAPRGVFSRLWRAFQLYGTSGIALDL